MMAMFTLSEIISNDVSSNHDATTHSREVSFDERLRYKLNCKRSSDGCADDFSTGTFGHVRSLFRDAATVLQLELDHCNVTKTCSQPFASSVSDVSSPKVLAHWVPGRIEMMGKHTDYAGGNSLVCATAGRGMAMVSTMISDGKTNRYDGTKVTIVSVLPTGMRSDCTTSASFTVNGRSVAHHTIHIAASGEHESEKANKKCSDSKKVNWTIYPTAVIHRLHQNFGLYPHFNENTPSNTSSSHIFIAIASNLPPASGLSTSSAIVTGLFLVLDSHLGMRSTHAYRNAIGECTDSDEERDEEAMCNLATYLGNVENGRDYVKPNKNNCPTEAIVLKGTVQGGVGTFGGSEDHAAILMGRTGELRLLSFCPTRPASFDFARNNDNVYTQQSRVELPSDVTFVIAYSGAKAEKAGGSDGDTYASIGYNNAADLARQALHAYLVAGESYGFNYEGDGQTLADAVRWERRRLGFSATLNTTNSNDAVKACISERIRRGSTQRMGGDDFLVQRFEQFYDESEYLVPWAAHALSNCTYDLLGEIVDASHRGAVNVLRNQIEETAWLPLWARGMDENLQLIPGLFVNDLGCKKTKHHSASDNDNRPRRIKALAASAFGAGFGGSCWALIRRSEAQEFADQWRSAYDAAFPSKNDSIREFFVCGPGPGACQL